MITITLQEAKAKLNHLVELAETGEQVVLMRGSKIVATILPINESDLQLETRLSDIQAAKFWEQIHNEKPKSFKTVDKAVDYLKKQRA